MTFSRCGTFMAALGGVPDLKLLIWRIEKESKIERKAEESKVRERGGERLMKTPNELK